ncbi:YxiF family protein [Bacillus sp. 2205SS5-2]|uniref:YxiF family protein n=1 Tax=Bacillus sp. 2205SS5-2 TaxID=3109031 RepID=UPI0030079CA3
MSDYKRNRIELLKRKNRRNYLIKQLSDIVTVSEESLMGIEKNDLFCKSVFNKLSTLKSVISIKEGSYQNNINSSIKLLNSIFEKNNIHIHSGRILFFRDGEIEAVELNMEELYRNLEEILEKVKFTSGYGDFILVSDDLAFGICIERTEYQYEFYSW